MFGQLLLVGTPYVPGSGFVLRHSAQIDAIFVSGLPRGGNGS